jgi:hypothetical protein
MGRIGVASIPGESGRRCAWRAGTSRRRLRRRRPRERARRTRPCGPAARRFRSVLAGGGGGFGSERVGLCLVGGEDGRCGAGCAYKDPRLRRESVCVLLGRFPRRYRLELVFEPTHRLQQNSTVPRTPRSSEFSTKIGLLPSSLLIIISTNNIARDMVRGS